MQCNIDAKGKAARLVSGLNHRRSRVGRAGLGAGRRVDRRVGLVVAAALLAIGGFQVFEGWAGWCVMRADGVQDPSLGNCPRPGAMLSY